MPSPQQEPREGYIAIGRVQRPWGLRGHVKVQSLSDFPERFDSGAHVWLDGQEHTIESARSQKGDLYLKLSGIDDVSDAEQYRGMLLEVPEATLPPLDDDQFYHHQLIGLRATTVDGADLGVIAEILPTGGSAVLVSRGPLGEVLIPFVDDVVTALDLAGGVLTVDPIDGMLPDPAATPARPRTWRRRSNRAN